MFSAPVVQRQVLGLKLHERGLKAKQIVERVGVSTSSDYSWKKAPREQQKQERDAESERLRDEGMTTRAIADTVDLDHATVARALQSSQLGILQQQAETMAQSEIEADETEAATPDPEPIPDDTWNTARAVIGDFTEARPDDYVARLKVSPSEWMTITDDS